MSKKALVVDDNRVMLEFMGKLLEAEGFQVTTALDGFEALNKITEMVPDIIFIDLIMPRIDGDKLCKIIRKMPHLDDAYVVIVSAAAAEMELDCAAIGANACIAKGAFNKVAENVLTVIEAFRHNEPVQSSPDRILGIEDVHPRQMTRELLSRRRHLESILDSISDGVVEVFSSRVLYANNAAQYMLGTAKDKMLGMEITSLFEPSFREPINTMLSTGTAPLQQPIETTPLAMSHHLILMRKLPVADDSTSSVLLLTDITEKRDAETAMKKAHEELESKVERRTTALKKEIEERLSYEKELNVSIERFNKFMMHLDALAFIKDADGRYVYANAALERVAGIAADRIVGRTDEDLFGERVARQFTVNDRLVLERREALNTIETLPVEEDTRFFQVSKFPMRVDDQPDHVAGIATDISDHKRAEEEKIRFATDLQHCRKLEAIGGLAGAFAHNLNNVLSGVLSYPELLLMEMPEDDRMRKPLELIHQSGQQAAEMVQDLLAMARSAGAEMKQLSLNDLISQFTSGPEHRRLLSRHPGLVIDTRLASDLMAVHGSVDHLLKSLVNLITNAAHNIGRDEGTVTVKTENRYIDQLVTFAGAEEGDYVTLIVKDTGVALPAEHREGIFEPFYTRKQMGRDDSGLAMTVVRSTVKDHGGRIRVESGEVDGNTVTILLPVSRQHKAQPDMSDAPLSDIMGSGEMVLVVDDMAEQREITAGMLEALGYRVMTVAGEAEAVAFLKSENADLVLLDLVLGAGPEGLDTGRRILDIVPEQRILFVTGFADDQAVDAAAQMGTGPILTKPYLIDKLGTAVRQALDD